ncbi:MAG: dihydroorotase [Archaeoglobus sp.]|nr:dihydroorotase [Archaeoglobus sp.]
MVAIYGRFLYQGEIIEAGIEIEDGIIKEIKKTIEGEKIDGLILPAAIDVHVHFRDFDESEKETIESGSLSALYGGNCLVVDQPNSKPFVDSYEVYKRRMEVAEKKSYVDYRLNLGLTIANAEKIHETVKKIEEEYRIPAIGEIFLQHDNPSYQIPYDTLAEVRRKISKILTLHAEDPTLISDERPPQAEIEAVKRCLELGNFHFCHISTYDSAILISDSDSTFEITPHHLLLNSDASSEFLRVNPPLRSKVEVEMLFNALQLADVLASDHAPHTLEDKKDGAPGFPGVETMYPLMVNLMRKGLLGIRTLTNLIAVNPARIFGFEKYGGIEVGNYANFAVFNLKAVSKIKAERLHTKAGWTPFENFEAVFPERVYLKGELALLNGEVLIEPGIRKKEEVEEVGEEGDKDEG